MMSEGNKPKKGDGQDLPIKTTKTAGTPLGTSLRIAGVASPPSSDQTQVGLDPRGAKPRGANKKGVAKGGLVANKNVPQEGLGGAFAQCLGRESQGITVPQLKNKWTLKEHNLAMNATNAYKKFGLEKKTLPKKNLMAINLLTMTLMLLMLNYNQRIKKLPRIQVTLL
jgi:hypothetical protein